MPASVQHADCLVRYSAWTQPEVLTLLDQIQSVMINDENIKYSTMADKLEWDKVKVGQHTPAECKDQWINITTKVDDSSLSIWLYIFYARKQLLRLSHRNSVCLSVRPSVCLSVTGWISQKRCKLGSPNLHRRLPGRL